MTDSFEDKKKACFTLCLLIHRYLYYVENEAVVSDLHYDYLERLAEKDGIPYFMGETGMVGYNENTPYHKEVLVFIQMTSGIKRDESMINGFSFKDLWPEQWQWHLDNVIIKL